MYTMAYFICPHFYYLVVFLCFHFCLIILCFLSFFSVVNLFVTILLINIFFNTSSLTSAINVPSFATEIFPVSSEYNNCYCIWFFWNSNTLLYVLFLILLLYLVSSASGNTQAAAAILLLLIITAPSCKWSFWHKYIN